MKRFVINLDPPASPAGADEPAYLSANDPALLLEESDLFERQARQRAAIGFRELRDDDPMFGRSLGWAYREYAVRRLWAPDEREGDEAEAPLGNAPPQPAAARERAARLARQRLAEALDSEAASDETLYLFNVIVAIEWLPTPQHLRQLEWAFRRASDYLYDVTNGCMAFGQVVFADAAFMDCADIQIMASNRRLPRSWTSGLLQDRKYTPVRVGRGLWLRDRRIVIDWDEPEGWRTLVHEWGHYALGLKDDYLETLKIARVDGGVIAVDADAPVDPSRDDAIVVMNRGTVSRSIMATPQGNSELDYPLAKHHPELAAVLAESYPRLSLDRLGRRFAGPGRLPLPLPRFRRAGRLARAWAPEVCTIAFPFVYQEAQGQEAQGAGLQVSLDDDGAPLDPWEVFTLRPGVDAPASIVAQGEIDARAASEGFALLGAREGDTVVVVGQAGGAPQIFHRAVGSAEAEQYLVHLLDSALAAGREAGQTLQRRGGRKARARSRHEARREVGRQLKELVDELGVWEPVPGAQGLAGDVVPQDSGQPFVRLAVRAPGSATLFPADSGPPLTLAPGQATPDPVPSLDGIAFVRQGDSFTINDYSEGGGPGGSAPNLLLLPLAAGSATGDALVFFTDKDDGDYSHIRVVTTTLRGAQVTFPAPAQKDAPGYEARTPVFSIASTAALPRDFLATLVLLVGGGTDPGAARIFRVDASGAATPAPTYVSEGGAYVAMPLTAATAPALIGQEAPAGGRIERYVLGRRKR